MPYATTKDHVSLYYEEAGGDGTPILFSHEFAGDYRNWELQMRYFSRRHRCITYSARGYLPSAVPPDPKDYTYKHWASDAIAILDHLKIEKAHVVGLSMGGFTVVVLKKGAPAVVKAYGLSPARIPFLVKDPRGFDEFNKMFSEHSALGCANTMRGFQGERPSLYDFEADIRKIKVPALIVVGDEDEPCLEPSFLLKQWMPTSGLVVLPKTGHVVNQEEPALFNEAVADFISRVDAGRWPVRDPRSYRKPPP
jgi:3-oxoadipate enol-lactonase